MQHVPSCIITHKTTALNPHNHHTIHPSPVVVTTPIVVPNVAAPKVPPVSVTVYVVAANMGGGVPAATERTKALAVVATVVTKGAPGLWLLMLGEGHI